MYLFKLPIDECRSTRKKGKWKKYKHLYYIFCHVMHCNLLIYEFIH
jgi:hypothetical protein